jgi:hypothetical protein
MTAPPQRQLSLWETRGRGSVADRYHRWRMAHPELFAEIERRVLACARRGDRRIEVNRIVSEVRADLKVKLDNSARAPLADELVARHGFLDGKIERRRRRSL